jgi:hypothetical protein
MVTPWDPNVLIRMVSQRLLMHAMPVATILIGLHFRECSRLPMDTA